MRPAELLPHRLHFELTAKEVLRVLLRERGQSRIGTNVLSTFHLKRDFFQSTGQRRRTRVALRQLIVPPPFSEPATRENPEAPAVRDGSPARSLLVLGGF